MKNTSLLLLTILIAGCGGGGKKNPVGSDLKTIREQGKTVTQMGPQKPREIIKTVIVEKPKVVTREESTIDDKFLVITPDPQMSFNEGQKASYKVRARVLVPGVKIKLVATDLPAGATFEPSASEKDLYVLSWTPALYTIPSNTNMKTYTVKLTAQVLSAENAQEAEKLKSLVREKEVALFLFRNQELPSELKISGLSNEVVEGEEPVPFTVTVKVPGMDNRAPQKPRLVVSYDGVGYTAGNSFLELDGSRYVIADLNKKEAEYLGNFQWKFSLLFDTKNISVQPQLAKDGSVMKNSDGTRVRLSFKVYNGTGLSTPDTLHQLKIRYDKAITAARFDFSGLGKQAVEVSRGETINLKFVVSSTDSKAQVSVTADAKSLPGSPTVTCQNSKDGANKQNCLLYWKVPCDADVAALNGEVAMTAVNQNGETIQHTLQTKAAKQEKKLCSNKGK